MNMTRRGLMLQKFGSLNMDFSNLGLSEESVQIIEFDRPLIDGNTYNIEGIFQINDYKETIEFEKSTTETKIIKCNFNPNVEKLDLNFEKLNYNEDHRMAVRLINLGVFGSEKIKKKLSHMSIK